VDQHHLPDPDHHQGLEWLSLALRPKTFTLQEANLVLPDVFRVTREAKQALQRVRRPFASLGLRKWNPETGTVEEDVIKLRWVKQVARLGAVPKGFFAVDFPAPDDEWLYCWVYPETSIAFQHKPEESFTDRIPILEKPSPN
jgi:hypothetical protein